MQGFDFAQIYPNLTNFTQKIFATGCGVPSFHGIAPKLYFLSFQDQFLLSGFWPICENQSRRRKEREKGDVTKSKRRFQISACWSESDWKVSDVEIEQVSPLKRSYTSVSSASKTSTWRNKNFFVHWFFKSVCLLNYLKKCQKWNYTRLIYCLPTLNQTHFHSNTVCCYCNVVLESCQALKLNSCICHILKNNSAALTTKKKTLTQENFLFLKGYFSELELVVKVQFCFGNNSFLFIDHTVYCSSNKVS